jgi:hypothetical protein
LEDLVQNTQMPILNHTKAAGAKYGFPLSQRGASQSSGLVANGDSSSLAKFLKNLEVVIRTHNNYARIVSEDSSSSMKMEVQSQNSHQISMYLDSIRRDCRRKYESIMTKLIEILLAPGSSPNESRLSTILDTLGQNKSIDEYELVSNDLWENGKINAVMIVLERLWSSSSQDKAFSFDSTMEYSFNSFRSPNASGAVDSVSMTLEAIHHVISNGSQEFITSIVDKVLIPLIDTIRPDICRIPLDRHATLVLSQRPPGDAIDLVSSDSSRSSTPTQDSEIWGPCLRFAIMKLEECALQLLPSVLTPHSQKKLLESLIKKKLTIGASLSGYSICLKEFLEKNPELKERAFFLFCSVLHSPTPQDDLAWAAKLTEQISFSEGILNSPLLKSERALLLHVAPQPPPPPPLSFPTRQSFPPSVSAAANSVKEFKSTQTQSLFVKSESSPYPHSIPHDHELQRMDSRKRNISSGSSSPVSEVTPATLTASHSLVGRRSFWFHGADRDLDPLATSLASKSDDGETDSLEKKTLGDRQRRMLKIFFSGCLSTALSLLIPRPSIREPATLPANN